MKIEKISDTQIKFILTKSDLSERNIKLNELAYGSEKTQALFKEIMEQAVESCGFHAENTPLMIEAIPIEGDSIMIIVSKVNNSSDIENKFNLIPAGKDIRKFKRNQLNEDNEENFANIEYIENTKILIYSFKQLEDTINLSYRLAEYFSGSSSLYKYQNKYFLILELESDAALESIDVLLSEYGERHASTIISKYFLIEHGESIIKESAVKILSGL